MSLLKPHSKVTNVSK